MLKKLVRKNRSYRRFEESFRVDLGTLRELVDLARLSASGGNLQPLKYILSCNPAMNEAIFPCITTWAGYLKDWSGPSEGQRPSAYIVILLDENVSKNPLIDHGLACQNILLGAVEKGLGGCILGSVNRDELRKTLDVPERYDILLVVALGKPAEKVVLDDAGPDGDTKYYRDDNDVHHVPKRSLDDIIIATHH